MSENEYISTSITLDLETMRRLREMANQTDRSVSAMVRVCVNSEWDRRSPQSPSPVSTVIENQ